MGEYAEELRELEMSGFNFFKEFSFKDTHSSYKGTKYNNDVWTDQFGKTQRFIDMDGFHLWNIKVFILRSGKRGLQYKLPSIERALRIKNYGVEEYRKDCERLNKEGL